MKKLSIFFCLCVLALLAGCESPGSTQSTEQAPLREESSGPASPAGTSAVLLDEAIKAAAVTVADNLEAGAKAAVINFTSASERFSEYVIEELAMSLVSGKKLTVVDRKELDLVRKELKFQLSGEVSDESAQAIGKMLGAQFIVSGSLSDMGRSQRFRVKAINVMNAAIEASFSSDLDSREERVAFLLEDAAPAKSGASPANQARTYRVGGIGPAGGIVFFDKGVVASGWRYLEAAPADIGPVPWSVSGETVGGTRSDVGSGTRNTQIIVDKLKQLGESGRAAQICSALDVNGYKDWFLPSQAELNLMYENLKVKGLGGFQNKWYWSSSQVDSKFVFCRFFGDVNQQSINDKTVSNSVRAIRAF